MSTPNPISADEFQALEQKVLRAVEVLRREREGRAAAEAEVARLRGELGETREELAQLHEQHSTANDNAAAELEALRQERAEVRQRVEMMLHQMDELM